MSTPALLLLSLVLLAGCGSRPDSGNPFAAVRTLTLASVSEVSSPELPVGLGSELESALRRSLAVRGYQLQEAEGGDAVVRASWYQENRLQTSGRREVLLGLSVSVFDRAGARVFSVRTARPTPAGQWNADRVAAEVAHLLRGMPEAGAR